MENTNFWWLNEESEQILNRGYLLKGESTEGAVDRITKAAANRLKMPQLAEKFKDLIAKGWMSLSSPIWANMGTERGLPISCFNVHLPDGIEEITHKLGEVIMQTKIGGGTSGYFGELRSRGSTVTDNGKSSGAVSFMKLFDTAMDTISQGGVRRGAFAAYLDVEHTDIEEFLEIKNVGNPIQNLFTGVCVTDLWMQEMIEGDREKRIVWSKILESRQQKGTPYIFFTDNVNRNKPKIYKDLNLQINSSNLCVAPYTEILTDKGEFHIEKLEGQDIKVWNGEEFSNTKVFKTGENQKLTRVEVEVTYLDKSTETKRLDCTEYHKWYDINGDQIITKDIEIGQELLTWKTPDSVVVKAVVINIQSLPDLSDTYCFTEPKRNMGMFNGLLTGQCSEIALPSTKDESFICCLSSMNLELYDEWKDTDAVETAIFFLDAVLEEFIAKTEGNYYLTNARNFAIRHRAIGLGALGWHSYLQKNMLPFEGMKSKQLTNSIFKNISEKAHEASVKLAELFGTAPIFKDAKEGTKGRRNTTLLAIAPTTSSSAILGQASPGIEPFSSNYFKAGLAKGNFMRKNKYLEIILEEKGYNNEDVWRTIMMDSGSVNKLDFLTKEEKDVFKTFKEISQLEIIQQASIRQKFIDQAQSLNLNIPSTMEVKDVNKLIIEAWSLGIKTLYYQRSQSVAKEMVNNLVTCASCES